MLGFLMHGFWAGNPRFLGSRRPRRPQKLFQKVGSFTPHLLKWFLGPAGPFRPRYSVMSGAPGAVKTPRIDVPSRPQTLLKSGAPGAVQAPRIYDFWGRRGRPDRPTTIIDGPQRPPRPNIDAKIHDLWSPPAIQTTKTWFLGPRGAIQTPNIYDPGALHTPNIYDF